MRHIDEGEADKTYGFESDVATKWFNEVVLQYKPKLPICFIPCSRVKPFTNSFSYKLMKNLLLLHNNKCEIVVLDEPFSVVPLDQLHKLPDYNFPLECLNDNDINKWAERVSEWLNKNVSTPWVTYCLYPYHLRLLQQIKSKKKFRGTMFENQILFQSANLVTEYINRMSKRKDWK